MNPEILANLLVAAAGGALPAHLAAAGVQDRLQADRDWIEALAGRAAEIYGVNRRPGHRDGEQVLVGGQIDLQRQILESHLVPPLASGCYTDFEVRCMGLAKACAVALGGTGMTPALYRHLLEALADPGFRPAVPSAQSYSSGDVIPAAHWAKGLLDFKGFVQRVSAKPGEAMALINGRFVHVGLAAAGFPALRRCGVRLAQAFAAVAVAAQAPLSTFERASAKVPDSAVPLLQHVVDGVAERANTPPAVQVAVSVRGIPELLAGFASATGWLAEAVERALESPSGNPLFDREHQQVASQGSFLAPTVTLAQSAVVEALLAAGWALVAQVQYLASGSVPGLVVDGATPDDPLGLIQVPKAMMATLEDLRLRCGRRAFASGSATSHGIEDLWTHGESLSRQVGELAAAVTALAERAWAVCELLTAPAAVEPASAPSGPIRPSAAMRALDTAGQHLRSAPVALAFMAWAGDGLAHAGGVPHFFDHPKTV